eukprot:m.375781 g.375781  ORF g.375781 m.375781 type:complete len:543 (-) comp28185_c0_seq19:236-1864(-)
MARRARVTLALICGALRISTTSGQCVASATGPLFSIVNRTTGGACNVSATTGCVSSRSRYRNGDGCFVCIHRQTTLTSPTFSVEQRIGQTCYDRVVIPGLGTFCGNIGPFGVVAGGTIMEWFTDGNGRPGNGRWTICESCTATTSGPAFSIMASSPSGACAVAASDTCIGTSNQIATSGSSTSNYSNDERCAICVHRTTPLDVRAFDVEAGSRNSICDYDALTIGSTTYCGGMLPNRTQAIAGSVISWSTDFNTVRDGWFLCAMATGTPPVAPAPPTATSPPSAPPTGAPNPAPTPTPSVLPSTVALTPTAPVSMTPSPAPPTSMGTTTAPSSRPTSFPTVSPTVAPTVAPSTTQPTARPTSDPPVSTARPTAPPTTLNPTVNSTGLPTSSTALPSIAPPSPPPTLSINSPTAVPRSSVAPTSSASVNSTAQNDAGAGSGSSGLAIYAAGAAIGALLIVLGCIVRRHRWRARARADARCAAAITIAPTFLVPAPANTSANEPPSVYDPYQEPRTYGEPVPLQRRVRLDQDHYVAAGGTADTT